MKRNELPNLMLLSLISLLIMGCLKDGNETIALPEIGTASNVIPDDIRMEFESKMEIYEGANPPDITGCFVISPEKLYYASDRDKAPTSFADSYFAFYNRKGNTYEYKEKQGNSEGYSPLVTVIGSGDGFTAYFISDTQNHDGGWIRQSTLITGTITSRGIENIKYAFIALNVYDPENNIMDENEYRIFYDGDGIASINNWDYTKACQDESDSTYHTKYSILTDIISE